MTETDSIKTEFIKELEGNTTNKVLMLIEFIKIH
jgi:hypothetical protein